MQPGRLGADQGKVDLIPSVHQDSGHGRQGEERGWRVRREGGREGKKIL